MASTGLKRRLNDNYSGLSPEIPGEPHIWNHFQPSHNPPLLLQVLCTEMWKKTSDKFAGKVFNGVALCINNDYFGQLSRAVFKNRCGQTILPHKAKRQYLFSVYLKSKQILPFGFALQYCEYWCLFARWWQTTTLFITQERDLVDDLWFLK